MRRFFILLAAALFNAGCFGIYDLGLDMKNVRSQVVVNSIITPDSTVSVSVMRSKSVSDVENSFEKVQGAEVEMYEAGSLIFSGTTDENGIARGNVYPRTGRSYSLVVKADGREMTASTDIPEVSTADFSFRQKDVSFGNRAFLFADISAFHPVVSPGLYITFENEFENGLKRNADKLYANSNYVDHINMEFISSETDYKESNMVFNNGFVRIPASVFASAVPLTVCSETYWITTGFIQGGEEVDLKVSGASLRLITPSTDYDRYCRSVYRQQMVDVSSNPFTPAGEPVYSNVRNGLGIFAGYSQYKASFGIRIPEDDNGF